MNTKKTTPGNHIYILFKYLTKLKNKIEFQNIL